jgi:DNA (cytosine-5)-methyltransferase 3A
MNVLSLFDGISCGQVALRESGIPIQTYYASEVDSHAISVTQKNFPTTKQIGDVRKVQTRHLPRIDILLAGSPCQGFSVAGKRLNFNDERSKLYFEFIRILKEVKPRYFLLENVVMNKECRDIITDQLGVQPLKINSSLVSAQTRIRLYWTNIPNIGQPQDMNIYMGHVIEGIPRNQSVPEFGRGIDTTVIRRGIRRVLGNSKYVDTFKWNWDSNRRILVNRPDGLKIQRIGRIACMDTKCDIITCMTRPYIMTRDLHIRVVTPEECEELQGLPRGYTERLSMNQRYKCIGNGWTVGIISHILKHIPTAV